MVVVGLFVAAALGGCSPAQKEAAPPEAVVKAVNKNCVGCHSGDRALAYKAQDRAQAEALIAQMVARGAQVSPEDTALLVEYFVRE